MNAQQWKLESPIGPLYLVASEQGLQGVHWKPQSAPFAESLQSGEPEVRHLVETIRQLDEYFQGRRTEFDLKLDPRGTPFQHRVWSELKRIPYGKTLSYRELAARVGNANASRAVGSANGRNPISIIVPCHRVIASDGTLGGYAGTLPVKRRLLDLEQADSR